MKFVKTVDAIDKIVGILITIAFISSLATVGASIFIRNVLRLSFPWTEEIAKYLTIFIVFSTAGLSARNNSLTRITFVFDALHLSRKAQSVLDWIVGIISIAFYVLVGYSSYRLILMVKLSNQVSAALKMPQWIPILSIVIGAVILILNTMAYLISGGQVNEKIEGSEAE